MKLTLKLFAILLIISLASAIVPQMMTIKMQTKEIAEHHGEVAQVLREDIERQKDYLLNIAISILIITIAISFFFNWYLVKPIKKIAAIAQKIADGNLKVDKIETGRSDELNDIFVAINSMIDTLQNVIGDTLDTASDLSAYSEELAASAEQGHSVIENNSQTIEKLTGHLTEISASSDEITEQSSENLEIAQKTQKNLDEVAQNTVNSIEKLEEESNEIEQTLVAMNEIAQKTELLSLNASIEAARAGEAGEGFAVVAEEIRDLSEQTAKYADQANEVITSIQSRTQKSLGYSERLYQQNKSLKRSTELLEETTAQIEKISNSIQDIGANSDTVIENSEEIKMMSNDITSSSEELAEMASKLQEVVEKFRL